MNACKKEPSACKNEVNKLFPEKWFASGNYRKQRDRAIKIAEGMQQSAMEVDKDIQNIIKSNNMRSLLDDSRVRKGRDEANALANKKRDEMNELVVKLRENRELLAEARSQSQTGRPRMRKKIHDHVEFKLRPQDVLVSKKGAMDLSGGAIENTLNFVMDPITFLSHSIKHEYFLKPAIKSIAGLLGLRTKEFEKS